jgi:hypothetical protein
MILQDLDGVEQTFCKQIEIAEKTRDRLKSQQSESIFVWQNNLLKFYMEHDINKAIDFSKELIEEHGEVLNKRDFSDLQFSLATSYLLEGSPENL